MKAIISMGANIRLELESDDEKALMYKAINLANPKNKCDECGNTEGFFFSANKDDEDNFYIKYVCPKCFAASALGSHKGSSKSYFWKNFEKYVKKS